MVWISVGLCLFGTLIIFLAIVRNANRVRPYSEQFCCFYLLKHMLPDNHPLCFMYRGLPRNIDYPRLLWPCISFFANILITISSVVFAVYFSISGLIEDKTINTIVLLAHIIAQMVFSSFTLAVPAIQNYKCSREMARMDIGQQLQIKKEIEQKWPGFFAETKNSY